MGMPTCLLVSIVVDSLTSFAGIATGIVGNAGVISLLMSLTLRNLLRAFHYRIKIMGLTDPRTNKVISS
ncbi:hypothetical protein TorRG33x02_309180 [Trema orientale]|uniref:Uncharacterized protein n=1 Tax=Trema orientale TaxID=63057 RepID=A0A2P5BTV1_TREOI|nr:hypothetical protein TorRG33x02_309180 [Trema orientale]